MDQKMDRAKRTLKKGRPNRSSEGLLFSDKVTNLQYNSRKLKKLVRNQQLGRLLKAHSLKVLYLEAQPQINRNLYLEVRRQINRNRYLVKLDLNKSLLQLCLETQEEVFLEIRHLALYLVDNLNQHHRALYSVVVLFSHKIQQHHQHPCLEAQPHRPIYLEVL